MAETIKTGYCAVDAIHLWSCNDNSPRPVPHQDPETNQITNKIDSLTLLLSDASMRNTELQVNALQAIRRDSVVKSYQLQLRKGMGSQEEKVILKKRLEIALASFGV